MSSKTGRQLVADATPADTNLIITFPVGSGQEPTKTTISQLRSLIGGSVDVGDKGDIVVSSGGAVWTIDSNSVSNAKAADMPTARIKGRATAGTGDPEDLTGTQATSLLNVFTESLKGLVPAPVTASGQFLKDDGTWDEPAGANAVTSVNGATGVVVLDSDDIDEGSVNFYHTAERVSDVVGGMVSGNTESGITVTYQDVDNTLDFTVTDSPLLGGQNSAYHLSRTNHSGTQLSSTISDFSEAAQDAVGAILTDTTTLDFTYDDAGGTIVGDVLDSPLLQGNNSAYHLSRTNHAGTQLLNTISDAGALAALDNLSTFDTDDLSEGATNLYNQTHTGDATGAEALTVVALRGVGLDSTVGTPSDGDILVYRSAGTDWVLEAKPVGGSNPALNDIDDVDITTVADNDLLAYDTTSGDWLNQTPAEAGFATIAVSGDLADAVGDLDDITDGTTYVRSENNYDDDAVSKLAGIEALADVTDETNVVAALDGATITVATVATGDKVLIQDVDDADNLKYVTAQSIADLAGGGYTDEEAQDAVGTILVDSATVDFTYDDGTPSITAVVLDSPQLEGNDSAYHLSRTNHTGSQASTTISDFAEAVSDQVGTMVTGNTETGITVTYDDADNTLDFVVADTTVAGDTGSTGFTPGDTLTVTGGTGITTTVSGDTLTITNDSPNVDQNIYQTITGDTGSTSAATTTDSVAIVGGTNTDVAVTADTVTINVDLGVGSVTQAYSANLDEYAAVNPTAAGLALLDDADNTAQRTTLGLGSLATESSINNANWSGTDLSVANGGTGASTLTGLLQGNGTGAITGGATVNNGNWSGTDLAVTNGGTGASNASGARTNLGLVIGTDVLAKSGGEATDLSLTVSALGNTGTGTVTLNLNNANAFTSTRTGNFTLAFSNIPSSVYHEWVWGLTNGGLGTVTFPTINWVQADGSTTTSFATYGVTLQSSGIDNFVFWTYDGTTIYGKVVR